MHLIKVLKYLGTFKVLNAPTLTTQRKSIILTTTQRGLDQLLAHFFGVFRIPGSTVHSKSK